MKKKIEKFLIILLICFISVNSIFPSIIYGYDKEYYEERIKEFIDAKIAEKVKEFDALGMTDEDIESKLKQFFRDYEFSTDDDALEIENLIYSETNALITGDIDHYLKFYPANYINNINFSDYIDKYKNEDIPEVEDIPDPINHTMSIETFKKEVDNWLNKELIKYKTDEEKLKFLDKFLDNWFEELQNVVVIDNNAYTTFELQEKINEVVKEKVDAISIVDLSDVTIEQAQLYLKYLLGKIKTEQEGNLKDLDNETKLVRLKEHFDQLIGEYKNGTGDFYFQVVNIADKIIKEDERQEFLEKVPSYIEDFLKTSLETNIVSADSIFNFFSIGIDSLAGILLYPLKLIILAGRSCRTSHRNSTCKLRSRNRA